MLFEIFILDSFNFIMIFLNAPLFNMCLKDYNNGSKKENNFLSYYLSTKLFSL